MNTENTNHNTNDDLAHAGVKGMRWGIRRYQNADGSLTDLGRKRYSSTKRDVMDNARSDAYNKAVQKHLKDHPGDTAGAKAAGRQASKDATATTKVDRDEIFRDAVQEDLDSTNTILRETGNASRTASSAIRNIPVKTPRMDLSKMTDKDMRDRIARERLESEYDSMFNPDRRRVENGKQAVSSILDGIGSVTTIAASALAVALAVKKLKGD